MKVSVALVKSFTKDQAAGNPTGIVLNADRLTTPQMQSIATTLGFAESVFVLASDRADVRLRFFAPNHEMDLCGHGTIAAFHTLIEQGSLGFDTQTVLAASQETRAGLLSVACQQDGQIIMSQTKPVFGPVESNKAHIAKLLGVSKSDFLDFPLQVISTGTPKLLIPLSSLKALRAVQPDLKGIKQYCRSTTARGFYPFTIESPVENADFFARQFNPLADENEDPVTGVAAGALGCYAKKHSLSNKSQFVVAQGYDLGKGGLMFVDVRQGVKVGGYATTYGHKELEL